MSVWPFKNIAPKLLDTSPLRGGDGKVLDCSAVLRVLSKVNGGVLEPKVSSGETHVSHDWACSSVPTQLSAGWEQSMGSLASAQEW